MSSRSRSRSPIRKKSAPVLPKIDTKRPRSPGHKHSNSFNSPTYSAAMGSSPRFGGVGSFYRAAYTDSVGIGHGSLKHKSHRKPPLPRFGGIRLKKNNRKNNTKHKRSMTVTSNPLEQNRRKMSSRATGSVGGDRREHHRDDISDHETSSIASERTVHSAATAPVNIPNSSRFSSNLRSLSMETSLPKIDNEARQEESKVISDDVGMHEKKSQSLLEKVPPIIGNPRAADKISEELEHLKENRRLRVVLTKEVENRPDHESDHSEVDWNDTSLPSFSKVEGYPENLASSKSELQRRRSLKMAPQRGCVSYFSCLNPSCLRGPVPPMGKTVE